jgi:hypothetical protein
MFVVVCAVAWFAATPAAQPAEDREAVKQAAADYVDALYKADPSLIERSVHPGLTKHGFWRKPGESVYQPQMTMSYQQLHALAGKWNKDGKRDTSIRQVLVLDVLDQTATAKVVAEWGIDYMQLAKYDGRWKIINILWQSHPAKPASPSASR